MFRVQFTSSEVMPEEVNVSFADVKGVSTHWSYSASDVQYDVVKVIDLVVRV